jgi:hypothetical protein
MLNLALGLAKLPSNLTLQALRSATNPKAINTLSTAIAQASLKTATDEEEITIDGINVNIDLNEERLLTTGGFSTALALGSVYWIGERLKIQFRYAAIIEQLTILDQALKADDLTRATEATKRIDLLSNPLLDPETFEIVEESDQVKVIYETLFDRPATDGSMFKAAALTTQADDAVKIGSKVALLAASEATEEALEVMITKAKPIAGKVASRFVGAVLWVDTVWWVATSAIDIGLNYAGIKEEDQRIPILADIPIIGALFDLSDSVGSSFVDLVISPVLDGIFSLFGLEDEVQALTDLLWGIITSAALNPSLTPFVIALIAFYVEEVGITFDVPILFDFLIDSDQSIDILTVFRFEPIDILIVWLYAIVAKLLIKAWVIPAYRSFTSSLSSA